jgi:hypothetical protein
MHHDENADGSVLTLELRRSLSELATPVPPPMSTILARGDARRRRTQASLASVGVALIAACAALTVGLTNTHGTTAPPGGGKVTRGPAYVLTSDVNGTDTLTLTMSQFFNPTSLQRALTNHGVPALVKSGSVCTSSPAPDGGVLSIRTDPPNTVTTFNPATFPSGTELFVGYSRTDRSAFITLVYVNSHTCTPRP